MPKLDSFRVRLVNFRVKKAVLVVCNYRYTLGVIGYGPSFYDARIDQLSKLRKSRKCWWSQPLFEKNPLTFLGH